MTCPEYRLQMSEEDKSAYITLDETNDSVPALSFIPDADHPRPITCSVSYYKQCAYFTILWFNGSILCLSDQTLIAASPLTELISTDIRMNASARSGVAFRDMKCPISRSGWNGVCVLIRFNNISEDRKPTCFCTLGELRDYTPQQLYALKKPFQSMKQSSVASKKRPFEVDVESSCKKKQQRSDDSKEKVDPKISTPFDSPLNPFPSIPSSLAHAHLDNPELISVFNYGKERNDQNPSKTLREEVWNFCVQPPKEKVNTTKCFVCGDVELTMYTMVLLHRYNAQLATKENLIPGCSTCNSKMGTHSADDYVRKHHCPGRLQWMLNQRTAFDATEFMDSVQKQHGLNNRSCITVRDLQVLNNVRTERIDRLKKYRYH